jgi:hypothetical protein
MPDVKFPLFNESFVLKNTLLKKLGSHDGAKQKKEGNVNEHERT